MNNKNDRFLGKLYDMLVREDILKIVQDEKEVHLATKVERVNKYIDKLKRVQDMMLEKGRLDVLRKMYYDRYIIKPEDVPEGYLKDLEKRYLDEGHGIINLVEPITEQDIELRTQHIELLISEQKSSLDSWLDYLLSADSDYLDMWAKLWAFQGMLKMGNFDVKKNSYGRRSKITVNPFVAFDSEMIGKCVELLKDNLDGRNPTDEELNNLVESGNFAKLYGKLLANKKEIRISSDDGIWVKYNYETNEDVLRKEQEGIEPEYLKLYNSLQGYNTGWWTAGSKGTAMAQICGLSNYVGGDFYVYYSKDENGEYNTPRIAIRMDRDRIGEIRGVAAGQNLESGMEEILEEKLKEFPDAEKYKKRISDMKMLTSIHYKSKDGMDLTREELRFLYEIDSKITTFGCKRDHRIKIIKLSRKKRKDLALALGCREEEIGFRESDLNRSLIYYYGDVEIDNSIHSRDVGNKKLPKRISGDLDLKNLTCIKNLEFPQHIGGSLDLSRLTSIKILKFPEFNEVGFGSSILKNVKGIIFLKFIEGGLYLYRLTATNRLVLPEYVGENLFLDCLKSAKDLVFPKYVGGSLHLSCLTTTEGLVLPEYVGGSLSFPRLRSTKGLVLPKYVGGTICYNHEYYSFDEFKKFILEEQSNDLYKSKKYR